MSNKIIKTLINTLNDDQNTNAILENVVYLTEKNLNNIADFNHELMSENIKKNIEIIKSSDIFDLVGFQPSANIDKGKVFTIRLRYKTQDEDNPELPTLEQLAEIYAGTAVLEGKPSGNRLEAKIISTEVDIDSHAIVYDPVEYFERTILNFIKENSSMESHTPFNGATLIGGDSSNLEYQAMALATMMNRSSNLVAQRTRRGVGNNIILSKGAFNLLCENSTDSMIRGCLTPDDRIQVESDNRMFFKLSGKLNDCINLYVNKYDEGDNWTTLYKGDTSTDCGIFFVPSILYFNDGTDIKSYYSLYALESTPYTMGNASDYAITTTF